VILWYITDMDKWSVWVKNDRNTMPFLVQAIAMHWL